MHRKQFEIHVVQTDVNSDLPWMAYCPEIGAWAIARTEEGVISHVELEIGSMVREFGSMGNPSVSIMDLEVDVEEEG